jgi:hypothetical protein
MATITEDYVSFETAKLLKEKGFDEGCRAHYGTAGSFSYEKYKVEASECEMHNAILAPTLQMAMKWLREVHNIVCNIDIESRNFYYYSIFIIRSSIEAQYQLTSQKPYFETYEQACKAAIKYCLENLI